MAFGPLLAHGGEQLPASRFFDILPNPCYVLHRESPFGPRANQQHVRDAEGRFHAPAWARQWPVARAAEEVVDHDEPLVPDETAYGLMS